MAFVSSLALAGCPKKGPGGSGAGGFDPASVVPADAIAIARLDVPTLLARPGLKDDQALVQKVVDKVRALLGIDPALLRDATIFFAPVAADGIPRRGAAIIPQVLRSSPGLGELKRATEVGGAPVYRVGKTATVTFTQNATIVGDFLSVQQSLEALGGKRALLGKEHVLWRVLDALGTQPFRVAVKLAAFAPLLRTLPVPGLDKVEVAGLAADVTETDLVLDLALATADPQSIAAMLKGVLGDLGAKLSASPLFKMFADLVKGVVVTTAAERVMVSAKIPMSLVRSIAPLLLGTIGIN